MRPLRPPLATTKRPTTYKHQQHTLLCLLLVLLFTFTVGGACHCTSGPPTENKMSTGRRAPQQRNYLKFMREEVRTPQLKREDASIEEAWKQLLADGIERIMVRQDVYGKVEITAWDGVLDAADGAMLRPNLPDQAAVRYKATVKISLLPAYVARQLKSVLPLLSRQVALVDVDVAACRILSTVGSNLVKEFDGTMRLTQNAPGSISGRNGVGGANAAALHRRKIQMNLPLKLRTDGFDCDASGINKIAPDGAATLGVGMDKKRSACNCVSKITLGIHRAPLQLPAKPIGEESPVMVHLEDVQFYLLVNFFSDHNHRTGGLKEQVSQRTCPESLALVKEWGVKGWSSRHIREELGAHLHRKHGPEQAKEMCQYARHVPGAKRIQQVVKSVTNKLYGKNTQEAMAKLQEYALSFKENNNGGAMSVFPEGSLPVENAVGVIIFTPLMERAHRLEQAGDIAFLDGTYGCCLEDKFQVYMLFTSSPCGGLPMGCFITNDKSENVITHLLLNYRDMLPADKKMVFGGRGRMVGPKILMTDGELATRNAFIKIWSRGVTLYCQFHILKNVWKNVNSRCTSVGMNLRLELYSKFRQLMYWQPKKAMEAADLKDLFHEEIAAFEQYLVHNNLDYIVDYLNQGWFKSSSEWATAFRRDLPTWGHNTNNICEGNFFAAKFVIFKGVRAFNLFQLVCTISTRYDAHYSDRIVRYVNKDFDMEVFIKEQLRRHTKRWQKQDKNTTMDLHDFFRLYDVMPLQGSRTLFIVKRKKAVDSDEVVSEHLVDLEEGRCTCLKGGTRELCIHISATLRHKPPAASSLVLKHAPNCSPEQKDFYLMIARGEAFMKTKCWAWALPAGEHRNAFLALEAEREKKEIEDKLLHQDAAEKAEEEEKEEEEEEDIGCRDEEQMHFYDKSPTKAPSSSALEEPSPINFNGQVIDRLQFVVPPSPELLQRMKRLGQRAEKKEFCGGAPLFPVAGQVLSREFKDPEQRRTVIGWIERGMEVQDEVVKKVHEEFEKGSKGTLGIQSELAMRKAAANLKSIKTPKAYMGNNKLMKTQRGGKSPLPPRKKQKSN